MRGHPNMVTTFSNRNHEEVFAMQSITGVVSMHMVKYLIVVLTNAIG